MKVGDWVECVEWSGEYCKVGNRYKVFEDNGGLVIRGEPCCSFNISVEFNNKSFKPASFRVGDKVRVKAGGWGIHPREIGQETIITQIKEKNIVTEKYPQEYVYEESYELMEAKMNKYQELKGRIESWYEKVKRTSVGGFDKEFDDILQEIDGEGKYDIDIPIRSPSRIWIHLHSTDVGITQFSYISQCAKLTALKDVALWLLDHSDIKKSIVGEEVKADIEGKTYKVKIISEL